MAPSASFSGSSSSTYSRRSWSYASHNARNASSGTAQSELALPPAARYPPANSSAPTTAARASEMIHGTVPPPRDVAGGVGEGGGTGTFMGAQSLATHAHRARCAGHYV